MEKSASNQANPEEIQPESEINSYIKQFMTLRSSIDKSNEEIRYWKSQKSKLLESNSYIEMNCETLARQVSDFEEKISKNTRIHVAKKQELKDLQNARTDAAHKQWNDCLSGIENYANDFSHWITNYSKHVLMKKIDNHQKECRKVNEELAILKQELNDMKKKYDLDYVEANVDDSDLSHLNSIIYDIKSINNDLIKNNRLEENTLNKIQHKIKQNTLALDEYKEKTNIF